MSKLLNTLTLGLILISSIVLIPLENHLLGWSLLVLTAIILLFCEKHFRRDMALVVLTLGLLGITQINTDISYIHIFQMGTTLSLAVVVPYLVTRFLYKENTITYPWHHGRKWYKQEVLYILLTASIAFLLLPFFLRNTGSYHNWTVKPGTLNLITLFLGTNGLGTWDELFFVCTVMVLLKKHFSFPLANAAQAVIWTAFLFELGFRGWAPLFLYPFALTQGLIFNKTHSLLYIITIHLTLDFVLYLALIHAYFPQWLPFFFT